MSYQAIQLDIDQAARAATITLNRPDKLNSFTRAMHRELQAALDEVEAGGARALILTGAGRGFCAGQDLADLDFTPGASTDLGTLIDEHFNPLIRRLQRMPIPVIAAISRSPFSAASSARPSRTAGSPVPPPSATIRCGRETSNGSTAGRSRNVRRPDCE